MSRGVRTRTVPIDKDKFIAALNDKDVTMEELSLAMGHGKCYLSQRTGRGTFPRHLVFSIKNALDIEYEEYAPDKKHTKKDVNEQESKNNSAKENIDDTNALLRGIHLQLQITNKLLREKMDAQIDELESIHKGMVGLEEVVYKGTKRAWNE